MRGIKKTIICFFCLLFVQSSFGYVKVKSLGSSNSSSSSSYSTKNTYSTNYRRTSKSSISTNLGTATLSNATSNTSGATTSTSTNNWATQAQIDNLDSVISGLEVEIGNVQTELDLKANIDDVYTKTEVDDKIDALSLTGTPGTDGLSAYEIAVNSGFTGTESEWLASLKGDQGDQGIQGEKGDPGDSTPFGCGTGGDVATMSATGQYVDSGTALSALATTANVNTALDTKLSLTGGTMTGAINMGTNKVTSLATPTDSADATTKSYVDAYHTPPSWATLSAENWAVPGWGPSWQVTNGTNTLYGVAACLSISTKSGSVPSTITTGSYCWCQITNVNGIETLGAWVYNTPFSDTGTCFQDCTFHCSYCIKNGSLNYCTKSALLTAL